MCFKSGFMSLDGLRWWHYIDRWNFQPVTGWCLAYCVTHLKILDFGNKNLAFETRITNFVFLILAARIVYLIGLGNYLARNSGPASTQTLASGSVFAAVLHC